MNRNQIETRYATARSNLLMMIILTAINIVLLFTDSSAMLLFSATVPYYVTIIGMLSGIQNVLIISVCIAIGILLLYLLCWIFSKKYYGWMIVALVLFIIDSICLAIIYLTVQDFSGILDAIIHALVLYYLIVGVKFGAKLKNMPEEIQQDNVQETQYTQFQTAENSKALRQADMSVKHRVLLESNQLGHLICYRRVKRTNELVIDGYVYDAVEMLVECAHALNAEIDGHTIQVGYDGGINSFLAIDGETVLRKKRFY